MTKSKGTEIHTELLAAERLTVSANGNPRWKLHTAAGFFNTQADAAANYEVSNFLSHMPANGRPVVLKVSGRGTVWDIEAR